MTSYELPGTAAEHPPGWYADPWRVGPWRWWDGEAWTAHVGQAQEAKPKLPSWLSIPVILGIIATVLSMLLLLAYSPGPTLIGAVLGLVPLAIVLPVLTWLDRVEPEPRASKIHAVLWGAAVAGFLSGVVNSIVAIGAGEAWAAVVSAPLVEEFTKGLGIYWALRRREVDGIMDGIVYAGWVALGFAVIEDVLYFADAAEQGILTQVFILRALLTPFAHPLFTVWIGVALGRTVERASPRSGAIWGYVAAVALHAAWNGSLVATEASGTFTVVLLAALGFVILFVLGAVALYRARRAEQERFVAWVPHLVHRHGIDPAVANSFITWRTMLAARRRLRGRDRRRFDALHIGLARLAALHANAARRGEQPDSAEEARLVDLLRSGLTAG